MLVSGAASFDALVSRAKRCRGVNPQGYGAEATKLSELARSLQTLQTSRR